MWQRFIRGHAPALRHRRAPASTRTLLRSVPITVQPGLEHGYCVARGGVHYLVAVIDWYSRYVLLAWGGGHESPDVGFCLKAGVRSGAGQDAQ